MLPLGATDWMDDGSDEGEGIWDRGRQCVA